LLTAIEGARFSIHREMSIYIILSIASVFPFNIGAVLDRNVVRFVDDYYTYQKVRVITTFTCSTHGTVFNNFPV
jgi:hypothetical protein